MNKRKKISEWTRCSEGFSDFKTTGGGKRGGTDHKVVRKRLTGDSWRHSTTASTHKDTDVTSQDILWSSSDSEDDTVSEIQLRKRKKVLKRTSPSKRKSLPGSQVPSSSETVDIVTSESESESLGQEKKETKSSGSLKTQEGSIQGYESGSDEELDLDHDASSKQHTEAENDVPVTDSPSISGSTQSLSPPPSSRGPGVKASDWAKSLQLKTPSKSESQEEITTAEDSAKKKKKHFRGGLAEQLTRLQAREKSSVRMWSHQQNKTVPSSQDICKAVCLRVLGFGVLYSMKIVSCVVLVDREEREHKLVMFPLSHGEQLNLQVGTEITVYPPWQQLEMNDGQSVMLCTRYCQVTYQPDDPTNEVKSALSEVKRETKVTATWNCPCVQGLCKMPSACPAYKFPSLPGLLVTKDIPSSSNTDSHSTGRDSATTPEKHLHTVATKRNKVEVICHSLLASIERSSEPVDRVDTGTMSINFIGTVHRVNTVETEKDTRHLLLVEDGHGAICEIQAVGTALRDIGLKPDAMEGKLFQFMGLTVKCRKTRDKDTSLFSLIDSVWSGRRGSVDSQDSENSMKDTEKLTVEPPSFCYILTCEESDSFSVKQSSVSVVHSKPPVYTKLSDITSETVTQRCSCSGKILYIHRESQTDPNYSGPVLYMTDESLQTLPKPFSKCYITAKHRNLSLLKDCKSNMLTLKDAMVDKGQLFADMYTKISMETVQNSSERDSGPDSIQLPPLDSTTKKTDLCCVSGTISEVDEDSAYSWEACNFCSSDQLLSQPTESGDSARSVICKNCQKKVISPDVRMKMEVLLHYKQMPDVTVRVDLLQSTIEKLLPSDEGSDEGYELSTVLNKAVGPLNCIVLDFSKTDRQKSFSLKEIELLL